MIEPALVPAPHRSPGRCFICGTVQGPHIDTHVEIPGDGRFYICTRVCLPLIARAAGYLPADDPGLQQVLADTETLRQRVADLEAEVEREKASKVVSLDDAMAMTRKLLGGGKPRQTTRETETVR